LLIPGAGAVTSSQKNNPVSQSAIAEGNEQGDHVTRQPDTMLDGIDRLAASAGAGAAVSSGLNHGR
jgi:hypothetical protein